VVSDGGSNDTVAAAGAFGYDIAIASRAVSGAQIEHHQNTVRKLSGKLYTCIQNRYLGIDFPEFPSLLLWVFL